MNTMAMVSEEHRRALSDLVDMAEGIEKSLAGLQAARDGVLELASRFALGMVQEQGHADAADLMIRTVCAELGAALRVSDRTIQRRMVAAEVKVTRFPSVWAAQGAGVISDAHARVIVDAGERLDDDAARARFAERMIGFAAGESPNRTRVVAQRLAERYRPITLAERHQQAREERLVWVKDHPDAMAEVGIYGPAVLVHAAFDRITGMGKLAVKGRGSDSESVEGADIDTRTLDQVRADVALDLLLTGAPAGHDTPDGLLNAVTANVSVTIPVLTLMGLTAASWCARGRVGAARADGCAFGPAAEHDDTREHDHIDGGAADSGAAGSASHGGTAAGGPVAQPPAELAGRSPIDPVTARQLAGAASGWDRLLTHPISGELLAVDRYRPTEHLKRHLRARDQRCRFPGCGMNARESDLDHTWDAALGGTTDGGNLEALCRRHHVLKHHSPWQVEQLGDGLLKWTSPTGRAYIDQPQPQNTVSFTPSGGDAGVAESRGRSGEPPGSWDALPDGFLAPF